MVRWTFAAALLVLALFDLGGCTAYVSPGPAYYYEPYPCYYSSYGYYSPTVVYVGGGGCYHHRRYR